MGDAALTHPTLTPPTAPEALEEEVLAFGDITLDVPRALLAGPGRTLRLGRQEAVLMELLIRAADRVVPNAAIEAAWYGGKKYRPTNLLAGIRTKRTMLNNGLRASGSEVVIHNVTARGYWLATPATQTARLAAGLWHDGPGV